MYIYIYIYYIYFQYKNTFLYRYSTVVPRIYIDSYTKILRILQTLQFSVMKRSDEKPE